MRVYFDTSLVISLLLRERQQTDWLAWMAETRPEPCFSSFGVGEIGAAIAAKVRRGDLDTAAGERTLASISDYLSGMILVPTTDADIRLASSFAARFDLPIKLPDAVHLAIAQRLSVPIASRDRQQNHAASRLMLQTVGFPD